MDSYTDQFGESFQRHLLAVLARTPGAVSRYRTALSHEYFSSDIARAVAHALFSYYDQYSGIPTLPTLSQLGQDIASNTHKSSVDPFVCKLYEDDISDHVGVLARAVEFGKYAALVGAILKVADKLNNNKTSIVERGRMAKTCIDEALLVGEDITSLGIVYNANVEERAARYLQPEEEDDVIATGVRHLDIAIGGGLKRGCLGMIIAPPGRGKTTYLCNVGFNAMVSTYRRNVVHISMEMDGKDVIKKYDDRMIGGVSRMKNTAPDKLEEVLTSRVRRYARGNLFVRRYFTRSIGVTQLKSYLTMLKSHGYPPDVVIVDYADILKPERRLGDARHEQAGIYEDLRTLAGEFDCAVWTASQVNRSGSQKDTHELADIAEAFEKAAIVDVGLTFSQSKGENLKGTCRIYVEKVRNHQDHVMVECDIRRERAFIRSIGLYDQSLAPLTDDTPRQSVYGTVSGESAPANPRDRQNAERRPPPMGANRRVPPAAPQRRP